MQIRSWFWAEADTIGMLALLLSRSRLVPAANLLSDVWHDLLGDVWHHPRSIGILQNQNAIHAELCTRPSFLVVYLSRL